MGPRLSSGGLSPVDRCSKVKTSRWEEETSPAQTRDHIFLTLELKETFPTTHAQKGSWGSKGRGRHPTVGDVHLPVGFFAGSHLG